MSAGNVDLDEISHMCSMSRVVERFPPKWPTELSGERGEAWYFLFGASRDTVAGWIADTTLVLPF